MHTRPRRLVTAAAVIATVALTAACAGEGSPSGSSSNEKITLRVSTFGKFGYTDLYTQYMKDHPNITVVETAEGDLGKYN
ncbi:MAG TPA: carbohydrate ABC transporter substrate-binding protein, partial [Pedococcus sp.]|nr:carbohydrate ABC transporter substrate-binding protein [Pedococcus sp.]